MSKLTNNELISGFNEKYTAWKATKHGAGTFEVSKDNRFKVIQGTRAEKKYQKISYLKVLKTIRKETNIRPKGLSNNVSKLKKALQKEDNKHWKVTKFFIRLFHKITGYGFCTKSEYATKILSELNKGFSKAKNKDKTDQTGKTPAKNKPPKEKKHPAISIHSLSDLKTVFTTGIEASLYDANWEPLFKADRDPAISRIKISIKIFDGEEVETRFKIENLIHFIKTAKHPEKIILMLSPNALMKEAFEKEEKIFNTIGGISWSLKQDNLEYLPENSKNLPSLLVFNKNVPVDTYPKKAFHPQTYVLFKMPIPLDKWNSLKEKAPNSIFNTTIEAGSSKFSLPGLKHLFLAGLEENFINLDWKASQDIEELYIDVKNTKAPATDDPEPIDLSQLTKLKNLAYLCLDFQCPKSIHPSFSDFKKLKYFEALSCNQNIDLSHQKSLKNAVLKLNNHEADFSGCSSLKSLSLNNASKVKGLGTCKSLKILDLEMPSKEVLGKISNLKNLETLKASKTKNFEDFEFKKLKNLRSFNGEGLDSDLNFADAKTLKTLNLKLNYNEVNLKGCSSLEALTVNKVSTIEEMSSCKNLKSLTLENVSKDVIADLPSLKQLETLEITDVEDLTTLDLSKFPNLKSLKLIHFNGTDNELKNLEDLSCLPKLESLNIFNSSYGTSNTFVGGFEKLKKLKDISVINYKIGSNHEELIFPKALKYCLFNSPIFARPFSFEKGTQLEEFSVNDVNMPPETIFPKNSSIPPCKIIKLGRVECSNLKLPEDVDFFYARGGKLRGQDLDKMKNLKHFKLENDTKLSDSPTSLFKEAETLESFFFDITNSNETLELPKCKNLSLVNLSKFKISHPETVTSFAFSGPVWLDKPNLEFEDTNLNRMTNLESLNFTDGIILGDDKTFTLPKLKYLKLGNCDINPKLVINEKAQVDLMNDVYLNPETKLPRAEE